METPNLLLNLNPSFSSEQTSHYHIPKSVKSLSIAACNQEDLPVLITGDAGVGKRVLARWIHENGAHRWKQPFRIAEPQRSIEEQLLEAKGGTLVFQNIERWSLEAQEILVHFLKSKSVIVPSQKRRLKKKIDVRLIFTSRENHLEMRTRLGLFHSGFYKRISKIHIWIPRLSRRYDEFEQILRAMLANLAKQSRSHLVWKISEPAKAKLLQHNWPGNLDELNEVLFHAIQKTNSGVLDIDDLPTDLSLKAS